MAKPLSTDRDGLIEEVLTKEQQDKLTPASVVETLKEGNARFVAGEVTVRNHKAQIRKAAVSQFPKAIILSCVDSRVPVEDVFDRGIGDLFVARVAGNFVNPDILGSMEFACHVSGAKVILVLGHEHCGAVKSAIDDVKLGNITEMLAKVMPAVKQTEGFDDDRSSKNADFVHAVTERNVRMTIDRIRDESEILRQMEDDDAILIVGAVYDMDDGTVSFLD
ncbi:Carbonic anhydrase 2 [Rubripirellula obstinata]|uniref:Carbonic anhydrase 2 n=1 Tax=Rubripirellula obstinata TaxID=406547 RepID=A0A5B1CH22_9BACT|nr:carbonic anhydrase family protein [Rubripirellula obstinata]KAA1258823.1 Carbonic anhydrase 2 [Rubripirellula obstinata]